MEIQSISQNRSCSAKRPRAVPFRGHRLFRVNLLEVLPDKTQKVVGAYFTKMDDEDASLMRNLDYLWGGSEYGGQIIDSFYNECRKKTLKKEVQVKGTPFEIYRVIKGSPLDTHHFMVECPQNFDNEKRVKALAEVSEYKDYLYLDFVQSSSKLGLDEVIKGGGTMILYGITKLAKVMKKKYIGLMSSNDAWYDHVGIWQRKNLCEYVLPSHLYSKFQKQVEQKFQIPSVRTSKTI